MTIRSYTLALGLYILLTPLQSKALTSSEFFQICEASGQPNCADIPFLQAYIGGSLDLLATLADQTNYLSPIYCTKPEDLFDVGKIFNYMALHKHAYLNDNAMLLVVKYFEEKGGCKHED